MDGFGLGKSPSRALSGRLLGSLCDAYCRHDKIGQCFGPFAIPRPVQKNIAQRAKFGHKTEPNLGPYQAIRITQIKQEIVLFPSSYIISRTRVFNIKMLINRSGDNMSHIIYNDYNMTRSHYNLTQWHKYIM